MFSNLLFIFTFLIIKVVPQDVNNSSAASNTDSSLCSKTCDLFSQECVNGQCECIKYCEESTDMVCTNSGKQYESRCHFFQDQCYCKNGSRNCKNTGIEKDYIVMYNPCDFQPTKRFSGRSLLHSSQCIDYHVRLASWLNYITDVKLREMYITSEQFNDNEYLTGMYTNELLLLAPFNQDWKSKISKITLFPATGRAQFDPRLPVLWHCILDVDNNGSLDDKELSQLLRVLLPSDMCLEEFLAQCKLGSSPGITLETWQSNKCFKLNTNLKNCDVK